MVDVISSYASGDFGSVQSVKSTANFSSNQGSPVGGSDFVCTKDQMVPLSGTSSLPYMSFDATKPSWDSYSRTSQVSNQGKEKERLFRILPRSAKNLVNADGSLKYTSPDLTYRGQQSYIKLRANTKISKEQRPKTVGNDYFSDLSLLISEGTGYDGFFLTRYSINYSEKVQIVPTFGDNEVVYYFGRQPVIANLSGILFDSVDQSWFSRFVTLYWNVLRGSRLAMNMELVDIVLPNVKLTGTISALNHSQEASNDSVVIFNLDFIVREMTILPSSTKLTKEKVIDTKTLMTWATSQEGMTKTQKSITQTLADIKNLPNTSNTAVLGNAPTKPDLSQIVVKATSTDLRTGQTSTTYSGPGYEGTGTTNVLTPPNTNSMAPIFGILTLVASKVKMEKGTLAPFLAGFSKEMTSAISSIKPNTRSTSSDATEGEAGNFLNFSLSKAQSAQASGKVEPPSQALVNSESSLAFGADNIASTKSTSTTGTIPTTPTQAPVPQPSKTPTLQYV